MGSSPRKENDMKAKTTALCAMIAAAFAGSAALADPFASTPPGASPNWSEPAALVTRPRVLVDDPAKLGPELRSDVKEETQAAKQAGEIVQGDAAVSPRHPKGGAVGMNRGQDSEAPLTRAEVVEETRAAMQAGDIVKGEADVKIKP